MKRAIILSLAITLMSGCNPNTPPSGGNDGAEKPHHPSRAGDGAARDKHERSYDGPPVTVSLLQQPMYPPRNVVSVTITAPSGGWSLKLDRGEVAENTARVYLTLEKPGAGEPATRALVDHQASYSTTDSFEQAEIYIHLVQRGDEATKKDYRLAKTVGVNDERNPPPPEGIGEPGAAPGVPGDPGQSPPGGADGYSGPPVSIEIVQEKRLPPISHATITVSAPTAGWSLALDRAEIQDGTAKIYMTLERPGDDEVVAQVLSTFTEKYVSEKPPFFKAEVHIHEAQRGVSTLTTNYRLAAKTP